MVLAARRPSSPTASVMTQIRSPLSVLYADRSRSPLTRAWSFARLSSASTSPQSPARCRSRKNAGDWPAFLQRLQRTGRGEELTEPELGFHTALHVILTCHSMYGIDMPRWISVPSATRAVARVSSSWARYTWPKPTVSACCHLTFRTIYSLTVTSDPLARHVTSRIVAASRASPCTGDPRASPWSPPCRRGRCRPPFRPAPRRSPSALGMGRSADSSKAFSRSDSKASDMFPVGERMPSRRCRSRIVVQRRY